MKIEGSYTIKAPRARLFALMIDPAILQRCMPGCEALEETGEHAYNVKLKAGVGSIKGLFSGAIKLSDVRAPEHYQMNVDGKGAPGFLKGVGTLALSDAGEDTVINYAGDVSVGGTLASVGQRMIQSTAKMMAGQFFAALDAEMQAILKAEETGEPYTPPKQGILRNTFRQLSK